MTRRRRCVPEFIVLADFVLWPKDAVYVSFLAFTNVYVLILFVSWVNRELAITSFNTPVRCRCVKSA
jgi:hypothetical protein